MSLKAHWPSSSDRQDSPPAVQHKNGIYDTSLDQHLRDTSQSHLFQAGILRDCLAHLKTRGLTEAYLRGSFASGEADEHSDIDLFLVVEPEKLEGIYASFTEFLKQKYTILVSCHDKLVKDYGGTGFMYLCGGQDKKLFQFDLYMAMKGVQPKSRLFNSPRIYSGDPSYCWADEDSQAQMPGYVADFIDRFSVGDCKADKMEYLCNDLMVTLAIMKKHIIRGQIARALNDNNHALGVCIEMLRTHFEDKSVHTPLYAGDKMIEAAKESADPAFKALGELLEEQFVAPASLNKVQALLFIGTNLVQEISPEAYKRVEKCIMAYDALVTGAADMKAPAYQPAPLCRPAMAMKPV
ncbi:MAG: nucleotidyltransferase domain-containing protein [Micavibrio aeruginosavorus]|nr:nucleotidyltransferase domain-containing protein [Micavibrio aeruginosavorus]